MSHRFLHSARQRAILLLPLCLLAASPRHAAATWPPGSDAALRIADADSFTPPMMLPDGAGGVFVVWQEPGGILKTQRYDSEGDPLWPAAGRLVTSRAGFAIGTSASCDAQGGLLVAWMFNGDTSHVYAQRLSGDGDPLWGPAGVAPAPSTEDQRGASIVTESDGGALMLWLHTPSVGSAAVRVQRFSAGGVPLWGENGLSLSATTGFVGVPVVVPDGSGGVHAVWPTYANFDSSDVDLFYQHVSAAGELLTVSGTPFCAAPGAQSQLVGAAVPGGDAVYAWTDSRDASFSLSDIFVQRVTPAGVRAWAADGIPACAHNWNQSSPALAVTPDGVAWCAWTDDRFGGGVYDVPSVFVQALGEGGDSRMPEFGLRVAQSPGSRPSVTASPDGEALIEWVPETGGIRVQKVNVFARAAWSDSGVALTAGGILVHTPGAHVSGMRTAVVWIAQLASGGEARAQVIGVNGVVGSPSLAAATLPAHGPGGLRVLGSPSRASVWFDSPAPVLRIFDSLGRRVARVELQRHGERWTGPWSLGSAEGRRMPAGLYFVRAEDAPAAAGRFVVLPD